RRVLFGKEESSTTSLCSQCRQRPFSNSWTPMKQSIQYPGSNGSVYTLLIALRSEPRPDPAQKELRGVGVAFRPRSLQRVLRSRKSICGVVCVLLCLAFRFSC